MKTNQHLYPYNLTKMSTETTVKNPLVLIDNSRFEFELGLKILKAKWKTFEAYEKAGYLSDKSKKLVADNWDSSGPVTIYEALSIPNLESRRVCFRYIGIENIFKELDPELVDTQVIKKATKVTAEGKLESFDDTYELYKVNGDKLREGTNDSGMRQIQDFYILKCSCTSTGREYLIYIRDLWNGNRWGRPNNEAVVGSKPDAVEAVAWTIQVEAKPEDISYIIRQGDAILVKVKEGYQKCPIRHISKQEYLQKVTMES
jgi:hypothetical protein